MRRFLQTVRPVWRVAALASFLAWLVGASAPVPAQALDLGWVISSGGVEMDMGAGIAVDGDGNSYVTCLFDRTVTFVKREGKKTRLESVPSHNMCVAKYDPSGYLLWARNIKGVESAQYPANYRTRIAVDGAGNSYVAGRMAGTATFETADAQDITLTSRGWALFVAKYDRDGRLRWVKQEGDAYGWGLAVDEAGNSYVTGTFSGAVTFGAGEAQETTLTAKLSCPPDLFVAKYDPDGRLLWVRQAGGPGLFTQPGGGPVVGIAVDTVGNSYITGAFAGTVTFGPGEARETTLFSGPLVQCRVIWVSHGSWNMFLAKYDSSGRLDWAIQTHDPLRDMSGGIGKNNADGQSVAVDGAGNSYVLGHYSGPTTFGIGEAHETTLTDWGLFVAKYDGAGRLRWVRQQSSGWGSVWGPHIAVDRMGDLSVIGNFRGSVTFGETHPTILYTHHIDNTDIFVAKHDANGALLWARQAGGVGHKYISGAAVDDAGQHYVTGYFLGSTVTFGADNPIILVNRDTQNPLWTGDIFVAKFGATLRVAPPVPPVPAPPVVVLANTAVTLDRPGISEGTIMSNGAITFLPGSAVTPSVFMGDLMAVQDITIHPGNTINSDHATAGGHITVLPGAIITGESLADAPVVPQPLPQPTFTAGGPNQTVPPGGTLALVPGTYGRVTVGRGGTLHLSSGEYFLRLLDLGKDAQLVVEVTDEPIQLQIVDALVIRKRAQVTLTPTEADSDQLTITTLQTKLLSIGSETQLVGTLLAPYASVQVGPKSQITGALIADQVTVQRGAVLRPHGAVSSLP